ncbi:uncharacterized protein PG998_011572 [Apiospora kogelbergensis]|uniref:uncharacterized protein n=1 Tax=Apiospora kogelbergensis TaxID=1337665 RepID=UPI00312DA642
MQVKQKADDVEDIREYVHGGYAVVEIGQVLNDKYQVVDKLGHSDSATVWLCWIQGIFFPALECVAVKVFKARCSLGYSSEMMRKMVLMSSGGQMRHWTAAHLAMPIEEFHHAGPNGRHRCLVMPLLGPSLKSLEVNDRQVMKKYLYQTAIALEYLHRQDIVHGGVEPGNIRFQLDIKDARINMVPRLKKLLGLEGRIRKTNTKVSTAPSELVLPADLRKLSPKGKIVLIPPQSEIFGNDVPRWYQAPEVLTGDRGGLASDVWSFCCLIIDLYAKCSLGLTQVSTENELMEHVKILERFLGLLRRPSGHVVSATGRVLSFIPPRRMCETDEEYEKWKLSACLPPYTTPMHALMGSDRFRKHFAPQPVQVDAVLPKYEALELATLLESALSYDEAKRSIQMDRCSNWFSSFNPRCRKHERPLSLILEVHSPVEDDVDDDPYKYLKEVKNDQEENSETVAGDTEPPPTQNKIHSKTRKLNNPLLGIPLDTDLDLDTVVSATLGVRGSAEEDHISGKEDLGQRSSPDWKIEDAKRQLEGAREKPLTRAEPFDYYILKVCEAYREHCEWAIVRVRLLTLGARDSDLYDDDTYWHTLAMKRIKRVLEEHARYRAERLEFYRRELREASSEQLRKKMLSKFPDLQDGELNLEELPRVQDTAGVRGSGHTGEPLDEKPTADGSAPEIVITAEGRPDSRKTQPENDTAGEGYDADGLGVEPQPAPQLLTGPADSSIHGRLKSWGHTKVAEVSEVASAHLKDLRSTVEKLLEPHLRQIRARVESGDPRMYYLLTGVAACIFALISILIMVLVSRIRASSTGVSVGNVVGLEALEWFQTRVASPYSSLYEGLVKTSASQNSKAIGESTGLEANDGNSLRGYLVTRFAPIS